MHSQSTLSPPLAAQAPTSSRRTVTPFLSHEGKKWGNRFHLSRALGWNIPCGSIWAREPLAAGQSKKHPACRVDKPGADAYNKNRKGRCNKRLTLLVNQFTKWKPSPAGVAVSAFYTNRHCISEDMECDCNWHMPHPLSGDVANRLSVCTAPCLVRTGALHSVSGESRKLRIRFPVLPLSRRNYFVGLRREFGRRSAFILQDTP